MWDQMIRIVGLHEANFLKLDCSKIKSTLGWKPVWDVKTTMSKIVEWSNVYLQHGDIVESMEKQIGEFVGEIV